ncbi:MAG: RNA polymerase factor sigma-54 [Saprospiraceae bacterium]
MSLYGNKQSLQQKLQQKLSPQQIQLMKLLQIPTASLEERIQEELEANPALEEGDAVIDIPDEPEYAEDDGAPFEKESGLEDGGGGEEPDYEEGYDVESLDMSERLSDMDDYLRNFIDDDPATYKTQGDPYTADEDDKTIPVAFENSFQEYLEQQLNMLTFADETERIIARQIIGSIDDDGYLRRDTAAMVDDLFFSQNIAADESKILAVLERIQQFDPPGIGARDLRECLLIQLRQKLQNEGGGLQDEERYVLRVAEKLVDLYFDEFSKKHYARLCKQLNVDEETLKQAIDEVLKLNPKPASSFVTQSDRSLHYIVPDFIVENRDGVLELSLNSRNAPDLRISDHYREMLRDFNRGHNGRRPTRKEKEAVLFIKQKIDSARWFIDAIRQRQQTMTLTMDAILRLQKDFFLSGDEKKIRPMILKDVAELTGLDISTVSRVANSKYVQTEFGVRKLKDFFSESLSTQDGEEVSTHEVKKILSDLVGAENKKKPLSDERLMEMLLQRGYNIARRTVAKYREQLGIPVARLRKGL